MYFRSYWADPIWKVLRITTYVTAGSTVVILGIYLSGHTSWLDALAVAVIVNLVLNLALLVRTLLNRARARQSPDS
ncbi:MAG TPA: hypothetical protein VMF33_05145 [Acidimicrobiales bacterium]|nr:hypothetical protein [Acidimicrobiales bacterium]